MATAAHAHEHGHEHPPEANRSSRIEAPIVGIYLFIASEVMLFGSFFTAYFFARVVANDGSWPPINPETGHQYELPVYAGLLNTVILVTSSFTIHWAVQSLKRGNRSGLVGGLALTLMLGTTFLCVQGFEWVRVGYEPWTNAFGSTFFALTGLHGLHVFVGLNALLWALIRSVRGHYGPKPEEHFGLEIPAIYWHFVDVMWIIVFVTVYII